MARSSRSRQLPRLAPPHTEVSKAYGSSPPTVAAPLLSTTWITSTCAAGRPILRALPTGPAASSSTQSIPFLHPHQPRPAAMVALSSKLARVFLRALASCSIRPPRRLCPRPLPCPSLPGTPSPLRPHTTPSTQTPSHRTSGANHPPRNRVLSLYPYAMASFASTPTVLTRQRR